jgi:ABC-type uncharacterized transport system substrate-binding protein
VKRREFIALLSGAAAWPLAARGQDRERVRRIGILGPTAADDPEYQDRMAAFLQALAQLGWTVGRNVRIDMRWAAGDAARIRKYAEELVVLAPDVILAPGSATTGPLLQLTRAVPIVFATIPDPVGAGFVESLARPGGNATGFTAFEYGTSGKWLELLKEIVPNMTRVGGHIRRDRPVCRDSIGGAVARCRIDPNQPARSRRVRARHRGLRGPLEWWPDRHAKRIGVGSSRSDPRADRPS